MRAFRITALLLAAAIFSLNTGCNHDTPESEFDEPFKAAIAYDELDLSKLSTFELSSDDLHDGVWDTVITKTKNGENRSPQLAWEPVDGASCYAIFMVDTTAANWLHWKSISDSDTVLPAGWAPADEYVGPYPPDGTHDYEVFVLALKQKPERIKMIFDMSNPEILKSAKEIDGDDGNIISYGHLTGTYTHGD